MNNAFEEAGRCLAAFPCIPQSLDPFDETQSSESKASEVSVMCSMSVSQGVGSLKGAHVHIHTSAIDISAVMDLMVIPWQ